MHPTSAHAIFRGKTVIITGAGSIGDGWGNGRATAYTYAQKGANLVLVDRDQDALAQTAKLLDETGARHVSVVTDVATPEGVDQYVARASAEFGRIDVLQANVGIGMPGPMLDQKLKNWDLIYRVNVTSLMLGASAVIPLMKDVGGGAIVNVSSIASIRDTGHPFSAYASSKAAANRLVRSIASEFAGDNVRANTVVVGYVDTPTVAAAYRDLDLAALADLSRARAANVPLGRLGSAWDIAEASTFLASEAAQFISGTEIVVDGGMRNIAAH